MRAIFLFLILSAVLVCSPAEICGQLHGVASWENDIRQFEHLDSTECYPDDAILFVGSSSIRLWSTIARDMAPYPVIQRGYGGAKLSDLVMYTERIVYPHNFRAVVLFVANDITGDEEDKSPEEVAGLFRTVIGIIRNKYPQVPVFWIAITPTALRWYVWPRIAEVNKLIELSCTTFENLHFIRTDYAFLNSLQQPREELFLPDMLHLNTAGYEVWTEIIKNELTTVLQQ